MQQDVTDLTSQSSNHYRPDHKPIKLRRYLLLLSLTFASAIFMFFFNDSILQAQDPPMPEVEGIHGTKFLDINGNGQRDSNEPGIPNWTIYLKGADGSEREVQTNESGEYWFVDMPQGQYEVSEKQEPGWVQTRPATEVYSLIYDPGQSIDGLDFGNRPIEIGIHGVKYHDLNGNGHRDPNEPGIPGWSIQLMQEDAVISETLTNESGEYWFMGMESAVYEVWEGQQEGWQQSAPVDPRFHRVEFDNNTSVRRYNFGNWQPGSIHGMKFHDKNGNGQKDDDEPGLSGWAIVVRNEEGQTWEAETNGEGRYWVMDLPPGEYGVVEIQQLGWEQTFPPSVIGSVQGGHVVRLHSGQEIDHVDFGNWQRGPGEVHGMKYHDMNGNGRKDNNEPGLPGWKIIIESDDANSNFRQETETNADGQYWFMQMPAGNYILVEEMQQGWHQTYPQGGSHRIMLAPNQVIDDLHFGNWQPQPGEIHGMKFNDLNGNGLKDNNEPRLSGWTIVLENDYGFRREAQTDDNGNYWFMGLPPGEYHVAEQAQDGWRQTYPLNPRYHEVELGQGQVVEGKNFGNWQPGPGEIHGMKYHDANGNGRKDDNELGLEGWIIVLGKSDDEVTRMTTDDKGSYWFMDLEPGRYWVKEIQKEGWRQTFPPHNTPHIIHLEGGDVIEDVNFGNWQPRPGEIHGLKFHDVDGNGLRGTNEPGLKDWTIVIEGENGTRFETKTDDDGNYWFMDLPPDFYIVIEQQQPGWVQTYPHNFHFVLLESGDIVDGLNFGNWQPELGSIHGAKFHDLNGNGQRDNNEPILADWPITLLRGDDVVSTTTTNDEGQYWFMDLRPGTYHVRERQQPGWRQTYPRNPNYHWVVLDPGQTVEDKDFGNWQPSPGSIHGTKFYDYNGNGQRDNNEPGLPGWTIVLMEDGVEVTRTTTITTGQYWFMDVLPGEYKIYERQQEGWQQTMPRDPRYYEVELAPGETIEGKDFGNWQPQAGSIHGQKFYDRNRNGQQDPGEPGLANWDIVIRSDDTIRHTRTNDNGQYWFTDLFPGTYKVAELAKWRWTQTYPTRTHTVNVRPGDMVEMVDFGNWRSDDDFDFCKIHWDIHFTNVVSVSTNIRIFNTSSTETRAYNLELFGLPKGTAGSQADGPDRFDIVPSLPIAVAPLTIEEVPIWIYYPDSFAAGEPGPAKFEAIVTSETSNNSFGCQAALWPVREDIRMVPEVDDIVEIPQNGIREINFEIANIDKGGNLRASNMISYTIHGMADGEEDESTTLKLNGLPAGNGVSGQIAVTPGTTKTVSVQVSFTSGISEATGDIVFEADTSGDGNVDIVTSSALRAGEPEADMEPVYVPVVKK